MGTSILWCNSAQCKYRVSRYEQDFKVERLVKKRVVQESPDSDYVWYKYTFVVERVYYVRSATLNCNPDYCAQAYYEGHCEHEEIVRVLQRAWVELRDDYVRQLRSKLARVAERLRQALLQLHAVWVGLMRLHQSRYIQGVYILFTPGFLEKFSLAQLLLILQAIRYPFDDVFLTDVRGLIQGLCTFNARQFG